jgi:hypothetical protein
MSEHGSESESESRGREPVLHAVLIGCDAYPANFSSLAGCVNDIDAVEALLLDPPGIGLPPERIRVTRLAAPRPGAPVRSRFAAQTRAPTRDTIVATLQRLAAPEGGVGPNDRVLVYYSGHGDQQRWTGSRVLHECLVPTDARYLWDVELNALVDALTRRTPDVSVLLDCCNSSGAYRDLQDRPPQGADRRLTTASGAPAGDSTSAGSPAPPDPALLALGGSDRGAAGDEATGGTGGALLRGLDPAYVAVAACQSDQTAGEGDLAGGRRHGILTHSLVTLMGDLSPAERAALRWADAWPGLLDRVAQNCVALNRRPQQPWLTGAAARRVFGGPWEPRDTGFQVRRGAGGAYTLNAGTLLGLVEGALVAVYGPDPARFPPLDSPADAQARLGQLEVVSATRATCTARPAGSAFDLPPGARGRLVRPGTSERLKVSLDASASDLAPALAESPRLEVVPPESAEAEVGVRPDARDPQLWAIGNELEGAVARVPRDLPETGPALRAGLEACAPYQTVVRLAKRSADPQLFRRLEVRLLDCATAHTLTDTQLADPDLPEAPRDGGRIYALPAGFPFALQVQSFHTAPLVVNVLNCTAGGAVEYLGAAELSPGTRQVIWRAGRTGLPFEAAPDFPQGATDLLVVVGTTRRDADLSALASPDPVQAAVDAHLPQERRLGDRAVASPTRSATGSSAAPVELWTAVELPLRIAPGGD